MTLTEQATAATVEQTGTTEAQLLAAIQAATLDLVTWYATRTTHLTRLEANQLPDPPLTVKQAAARLNRCPSTVLELIHTGKLRHIPGAGRGYRIPPDEIARYLNQ